MADYSACVRMYATPRPFPDSARQINRFLAGMLCLAVLVDVGASWYYTCCLYLCMRAHLKAVACSNPCVLTELQMARTSC